MNIFAWLCRFNSIIIKLHYLTPFLTLYQVFWFAHVRQAVHDDFMIK